MSTRLIQLIATLVISATFVRAMEKSAGNSPYVVTSGERSPFYARCIAAKATGSEGITQVLRVRPENDEVIATHAWYNRNGIVLGWTSKEGKIAVMRLRQGEGSNEDEKIEFSFYLGDRLLRSYTTADLVKLGANVEQRGKMGDSSKRAIYSVEGCKQVWNTNDYYFSVKLSDAQTLCFDVLTGRLCRIETDGSKQRLITNNDSENFGNSPKAEEALSTKTGNGIEPEMHIPSGKPSSDVSLSNPAKPATPQPPAYVLSIARFSDTVGLGNKPEWIFVIGGSAYRTLDALKAGVTRFPSGSSLTWAPGCCRIGGEPLSTSEELKDLKAHCESHGIRFVLVPAG